MDAVEIYIRQILQQYLQAHPSATRDELACHAVRQFEGLGRRDWWKVNETIDKALKDGQ